VKNYLLVGLGNPGIKYERNRHNIGFCLIDYFTSQINSEDYIDKFNSKYTMVRLNDNKIHIIKPQTYMNRSGVSVRNCKDFFKIAPNNIIVVYDDMDLALGSLKIKSSGGSAGHNGIKSLIDEIGSNNFVRIRIGIGKPLNKENVNNYVLSNFKKDEFEALSRIKNRIEEIIKDIIFEGIIFAMNKFNSKIQ
tara:strand:+ start:8260 stop:8835 length:576 start_codon:yes stop_codon:yes gene_type:complete